jgi:hypothetical protein
LDDADLVDSIYALLPRVAVPAQPSLDTRPVEHAPSHSPPAAAIMRAAFGEVNSAPRVPPPVPVVTAAPAWNPFGENDDFPASVPMQFLPSVAAPPPQIAPAPNSTVAPLVSAPLVSQVSTPPNQPAPAAAQAVLPIPIVNTSQAPANAASMWDSFMDPLSSLFNAPKAAAATETLPVSSPQLSAATPRTSTTLPLSPLRQPHPTNPESSPKHVPALSSPQKTLGSPVKAADALNSHRSSPIIIHDSLQQRNSPVQKSESQVSESSSVSSPLPNSASTPNASINFTPDFVSAGISPVPQPQSNSRENLSSPIDSRQVADRLLSGSEGRRSNSNSCTHSPRQSIGTSLLEAGIRSSSKHSSPNTSAKGRRSGSGSANGSRRGIVGGLSTIAAVLPPSELPAPLAELLLAQTADAPVAAVLNKTSAESWASLLPPSVDDLVAKSTVTVESSTQPTVESDTSAEFIGQSLATKLAAISVDVPDSNASPSADAASPSDEEPVIQSLSDILSPTDMEVVSHPKSEPAAPADADSQSTSIPVPVAEVVSKVTTQVSSFFSMFSFGGSRPNDEASTSTTSTQSTPVDVPKPVETIKPVDAAPAAQVPIHQVPGSPPPNASAPLTPSVATPHEPVDAARASTPFTYQDFVERLRNPAAADVFNSIKT